MPTLLHIDSSPRSASVSSSLAAGFVADWQRQNLDAAVLHHNTSLENLPYLDESSVAAFYSPADAPTPQQTPILALSDKLIDELLAADVLVLGVPMWNLGIPASLKAWIDLIIRVGRTFAFTEAGVASLVPPGKKVYVFSSRGGTYQPGTPYHAFDQQEPYLRTFLGFLGMTDIVFIHAENQSNGPDAAAAGVAHAQSAAAALFA